ncbi:MAG: CDP-diacylglycerol--glycerol-3-phosphate 3-phosphatidyltransferase [Oscillospiraceae bacterium]|jgi:cardiolipin synthase|nr:CDP-diacylglycerol--glycerol-3-phosphate 3-phosphatidyltransferase [Oscillospiraceae bacterium]
MKSVPNILSVFRICLVPIFAMAYFLQPGDIKYFALIVFITAGVSDFFDGYFARKYNAQSSLGKVLDPLGDKLMTFTVLICLAVTMPVLIWAVLVFFVKEALMGIGGLVIHKMVHIELPPANIFGKISTFVFFVACATLILFQQVIPEYVVNIIIAGAIALTLFAFATYIKLYAKTMKTRPKKENGDK